MKKVAACFFVLLVLCAALAAPACAAGFALPEDVTLTAASVYMVNLDTGITVYEQDADTPRSVASLTKLMTALLLIENVPDLAGTMITAESVLYVPPITNSNSSHADIRPGEEVSALDMLYAIMLPSANEAAEAVGYYLGNGNLNNFYALMNARAAELGCTNTNFTSTNGLVEMDEGNYSTARDLARIAQACWQYEIFRTVAGSTEHEMPASNKHSAAYTIRSTNAMLKSSSGSAVYRSYIRGIKTGSTEAAGRNLVSAAVNSNGESYLCVVLGCPYEAEATTGYAYSFFDTAALYDWVFANFSVQPSLDTTAPITEIRVNYSTEADTLRLYPASDLKTVLPTGDDDALEHTFNLPDSVDAPIQQGDVVGTVTLTLSGEVLGTVDLIAGQDVARNPLLYAIAQIQVFFGSLYFRVVVVLTVLFLLGYGGLTIHLHRQAKGRKPAPRRKAAPKASAGRTPAPQTPPQKKPLSPDPEDGVFFRFDD